MTELALVVICLICGVFVLIAAAKMGMLDDDGTNYKDGWK